MKVGEPRPEGRTGGKAKPGIAFQWKGTGKRLGAHQPCKRNSIGLWNKREDSSTCGIADAMRRGNRVSQLLTSGSAGGWLGTTGLTRKIPSKKAQIKMNHPDRNRGGRSNLKEDLTFCALL